MSAVPLYLAIQLTSAIPSPHKTWCDGRPCRPGEGNPTVTHGENPYETAGPPDFIKTPPHTPDPSAPHYASLVEVARAHAPQPSLVQHAATGREDDQSASEDLLRSLRGDAEVGRGVARPRHVPEHAPREAGAT